MRIEQSYYQKAKAAFHATQALLTFVAGCLALAILTKSGNHGGQVGFYFALVSLHWTRHRYPSLIHHSASSPSPP